MPWGFSPLDEALGLGGARFAPQVVKGLAQLGTWLPFEQVPAAARALWRLSISEETVRRLTEQAGAALVAADEAAVTRLEQGEALPGETGPALQQLSVDGAMVPLLGGQWGEVKTLVIGTVEQRQTQERTQPKAVALTYFSRLADAETFGRQASVETHRRGTATAAVVCGPADGAVWVQRFLDLQRPDAVRILDFPHAVEHLGTAASATFGAASVAGQTWLRGVRRELRDGEPAAALAALCELPVETAAEPAHATAARDAAVSYFASRWAQIQYARFRAAGYPIGSGAVESANKLVVEARLKGSGMHWAPQNVNSLLALRTAWCSGRFAERWQERIAQPAAVRRCRRLGDDSQRPEAPPTSEPAPLTTAVALVPDHTLTEWAVPTTTRPPLGSHPWRRYGRCLTPRSNAKL